MSRSAPHWPIQSIDELPSHVRMNPNGLQIDAGGADVTFLAARVLPMQGETIGYAASIVVSQSDLISQRNGREGLGLFVQGLVRQGDSLTPRVVSSNNLLDSGDESMWVNLQTNSERRLIFIGQLDGPKPDYLDGRWVVRGQGGSITLNDAQLRNHYSRVYETEIGPATWLESAFSQKQLRLVAAGRDAQVWVRNIDQHVFDAEVGQRVQIDITMDIDASSVFFPQVQRTQRHSVSVGLRCQRQDGGEFWWWTGVATDERGTTLSDELLQKTSSFILKTAIVRADPMILVYPRENFPGSRPRLRIEGLQMTITVHDNERTASTDS